jgi:hypothetical protein
MKVIRWRTGGGIMEKRDRCPAATVLTLRPARSSGHAVVDRCRPFSRHPPTGGFPGAAAATAWPAAIAGATICFGSIVSTKMACSPAVMNQENRFFAALNGVEAVAL